MTSKEFEKMTVLGTIGIILLYLIVAGLASAFAYSKDDDAGIITAVVFFVLPIVLGYLYVLFIGVRNLWLWIAQSTPPSLAGFFTILILIVSLFGFRVSSKVTVRDT